MPPISASIPAHSRNTALVTGGNSGVGFECARALARAGWQVIIASRNRELSAEAVRRINAESGVGAATEMGLDLGSVASVRAFVAELRTHDVPLRALVCNAGLQMHQGPVLSPDGYEMTFAVNHLGHFLLTNLLLDVLLTSAPARILIVASGVHDPALFTGMPKPAVSDIQTLATTGGPRAGEFNGQLAYVNSKLCNLWFTHELVRRLAQANFSNRLSVNAFEPGLVPGSGLARDYPPVLRFLWNSVLPGVARVLSRFIAVVNPADKAGAALARFVQDPALEHVSGKYFPSHTRWRAARSSEASYDVARGRTLWDESVRMTQLTAAESLLARI